MKIYANLNTQVLHQLFWFVYIFSPKPKDRKCYIHYEI